MRPGEAVSVRGIEHRSLVLAALLLGASLFLRDAEVTVGVLLGALLALLNFRWLGRFVAALVTSGRRRPSRLLVALYTLKYVFSGLVIFVAIKYDLADVVALLAGVSVVFLAICWEGVCAHRRLREGADHAAEF